MEIPPLTPGILDAYLSRYDRRKPVCFCRSIDGLSFYRFKMRGERLQQVELGESIYRNSEGRLVIDFVPPATPNPSEHAPTVERFLLKSSEAASKNYHLFFGGSEDALTFTGTEDMGEWVSINFAQRIYRSSNGGLIVEEMIDGEFITTEFAPTKSDDDDDSGPRLFPPEVTF